jgi:hypothetical protein
VTNRVYRSNEVTQAYYRLAQIQYAGSTLAPKGLQGRLLTLNLRDATTGNGVGTLKVTFDASAGGTYTFSDGSGPQTGNVTEYTWTQEPYRGNLWPIYYSGLVTMTIRLDFTSATQGKLTGTAYTTVPFAISGSFTLGP